MPDVPDELRKVGPYITDRTRAITDVNRGLAAAEERTRKEEEEKRKRRPKKLSPPPTVGQGRHVWHCWAASSSSWVQVVSGENLSREYFVKKYANAPNGGLNSGRATPLEPGVVRPSGGFSALMKDLHMDYAVIAGQRLTAELVATKIEKHGYLLLFYNMSVGGPAHTVVVYGINYPNGGTPIKLSVMDPMGPGGLFDVELDIYQSKNGLILGWSRIEAQ
jgi:hypothetical protein